MSNKELVESDSPIYSSVEKLKSKVNNFAVVDKQGQMLGEVKDLILDGNYQLNFVISQLATAPSPRVFLLLSKLVERIDYLNKLVFANVNEAEVENFPEYADSETLQTESSQTLTTSATPTYDLVEEDIPKDSDQIDGISVKLALPTDRSSVLQPLDTPEVSGGENAGVRILEERLVVDRIKSKLGEVIIRKEIETRMVLVPIQREKLIVEQVSLEEKQLADIELGEEDMLAIELTVETTENRLSKTVDSANELIVIGEFVSAKTASLLLNAIALERNQRCKKVRVKIVTEDAECQQIYQKCFNRFSDSQTP